MKKQTYLLLLFGISILLVGCTLNPALLSPTQTPLPVQINTPEPLVTYVTATSLPPTDRNTNADSSYIDPDTCASQCFDHNHRCRRFGGRSGACTLDQHRRFPERVYCCLVDNRSNTGLPHRFKYCCYRSLFRFSHDTLIDSADLLFTCLPQRE